MAVTPPETIERPRISFVRILPLLYYDNAWERAFGFEMDAGIEAEQKRITSSLYGEEPSKLFYEISERGLNER